MSSLGPPSLRHNCYKCGGTRTEESCTDVKRWSVNRTAQSTFDRIKDIKKPSDVAQAEQEVRDALEDRKKWFNAPEEEDKDEEFATVCNSWNRHTDEDRNVWQPGERREQQVEQQEEPPSVASN